MLYCHHTLTSTSAQYPQPLSPASLSLPPIPTPTPPQTLPVSKAGIPRVLQMIQIVKLVICVIGVSCGCMGSPFPQVHVVCVMQAITSAFLCPRDSLSPARQRALLLSKGSGEYMKFAGDDCSQFWVCGGARWTPAPPQLSLLTHIHAVYVAG